MSVSVCVCDSSCQDLIPSLWMNSNLEKHSKTSTGGAAVRNQKRPGYNHENYFSSLLGLITGHISSASVSY